jgi:hypothetical protein
MPYREVQRDSAGRQAVDAGYFTGVVAHRPAGWQFLSANWSPASVVGAAR